MSNKLTPKLLPNQIPVFFLSGFLGSGKSTLLNELLSDPSFHDSAVIINEFGDVAVDHLLVRQGETAISQVSTGCLCCAGGTDIRATLFDLHCAASSGLAPKFARVIVEMSGLGDPAPLINALMPGQHDTGTLRDETLDESFYLAGFNTLFDIVTGELSVERYFEALKQVAFADRIVLTKTDLAKDPATKADIRALPDQLRMINTDAQIIDRRDSNLSDLFSPRMYSALDRGDDVIGWLALEAVLASEDLQHGSGLAGNGAKTRHGEGVQTFCLVRENAIPEERFNAFIALLQSSAGARLLRVKGIVGLLEHPDRPQIIHVVQHAVSKPVMLDGWPDDDTSTRLVFITDGIDAAPVRKLFEAAIDGNVETLRTPMRTIADAFRASAGKTSKFIGRLAQGLS